MKYYKYQDQTGEYTLSEQEIFDIYWPFWYNKMVVKYGQDHPLTTRDNCLADWVTVNWAFEVEKPSTEK